MSAACVLVAALSLTLPACRGGGPESDRRPESESRPESAPHSGAWSVPTDDSIRALLAERMARNGVGTVVGVIDGDRRSVVAYGRSGAPDERPLDGATVFQLGSLTKVITGLLLADMVLSGDVGLDEPVADLLAGEVVLKEVGRPITLRDLSTHTSGLPSMPSNFDIRGMPDPFEAYTVGQLWTFLSEEGPTRSPGTAYEYSNLGVSLLGRALAMRSGTTYESLVRERVLLPLGMTSTSITLDADQERRLAPGHDPYLHPIRTWEMATLQASGSLRSTADDMLELLAVYLGSGGSSRLREAAALQLREGATVDGSLRRLGIGRGPDGVFQHAGGKQGYRSGLAFDPVAGIGAVVLANTRTYADEPMRIARYLVTGEPLPPATTAPADKPRVRLPAALLERFAGRYRSDDGDEWEVVVVGDRLRLRYPGSSILEFVAADSTWFFYDAGNDDITFSVDAAGAVTAMTVFGDGRPEGGGITAQRVGS